MRSLVSRLMRRRFPFRPFTAAYSVDGASFPEPSDATSRGVLTTEKYHLLAEDTLQHILSAFETLLDTYPLPGADVEYSVRHNLMIIT